MQPIKLSIAKHNSIVTEQLTAMQNSIDTGVTEAYGDIAERPYTSRIQGSEVEDIFTQPEKNLAIAKARLLLSLPDTHRVYASAIGAMGGQTLVAPILLMLHQRTKLSVEEMPAQIPFCMKFSIDWRAEGADMVCEVRQAHYRVLVPGTNQLFAYARDEIGQYYWQALSDEESTELANNASTPRAQRFGEHHFYPIVEAKTQWRLSQKGTLDRVQVSFDSGSLQCFVPSMRIDLFHDKSFYQLVEVGRYVGGHYEQVRSQPVIEPLWLAMYQQVVAPSAPEFLNKWVGCLPPIDPQAGEAENVHSFFREQRP